MDPVATVSLCIICTGYMQTLCWLLVSYCSWLTTVDGASQVESREHRASHASPCFENIYHFGIEQNGRLALGQVI